MAKAKKKPLTKKQSRKNKFNEHNNKSNKVVSTKRKPNSKRNKLDKQGSSPRTPAKQKARNPSGKGGFVKGKSGNPNGRPPNGQTKMDTLLKAIGYYQMGGKLDPKNPVHQFIRRAFKNDNVLIAMMRKIYPDLKAIEQVTFPGDTVSQEEEERIRKEYEKRFGTKLK